MKKSFYRSLVVAMLVIVTTAANAQFIVKIRPVAPVVVRTVAPSSRHIWVDGEWVWRNGGYQYVNGYWAAAPMSGAVWVPGHWKQTRRGWMWKPGHWRRRW
jgi:hypothetical protein